MKYLGRVFIAGSLLGEGGNYHKEVLKPSRELREDEEGSVAYS